MLLLIFFLSLVAYLIFVKFSAFHFIDDFMSVAEQIIFIFFFSLGLDMIEIPQIMISCFIDSL